MPITLSFTSAVNHMSSRFPAINAPNHSLKRVLLATLPIVFLAFLPQIYGNYQAFLSLGQSRIPHNVFGWLFSTVLKPIGRETQGTKMYELDADKSVWLERDLPKRKGERPATGWHFAPHRQTSQFPDHNAREVSFLS